MLPYQQRVVEERRQLDNKVGLLDQFLSTNASINLTHEERSLLALQSDTMKLYSAILQKRISLF